MRKYIIPAVAITAFLATGSVSLASTDLGLATAKLDAEKWFAMAAALVLGISVALGTIAQSLAARAGLEGTARNPNAASKLFTPLILSLALIESLVISAALVAFTIVGRIGK